MEKFKRFGVIGAMEIEVSRLKEIMEIKNTERHASMEFCEGTYAGKDVVAVRSGVGKVNAALCTQILIDRFGIDAIINTGVAGSLNAEINIGDMVVSTDAVQHDVDATVFGYEYGEVPQLGKTSFEADEELRALAVLACREAAPDVGVFEGRVLSGDQFISDPEVKKTIKERFSGLCTEMEGAAIAQAADLSGIPYVILRAISDKADGSDIVDYPVFEAKAADDCVKIVLRMLEKA